MKDLVVCLVVLLSQCMIAGAGSRPSISAGGIGRSSQKILYVSLTPFVRSYQSAAQASTRFGTQRHAAGSLPDAGFVLRDAYVYPNPAKSGKKPVIHVETGIADQVQFHIYDAAGDLVHTATISYAPQVINDGTGSEYAYEYPWEGDIASGVYICVIRAQKAGYADINKTVKLAVIR